MLVQLKSYFLSVDPGFDFDDFGKLLVVGLFEDGLDLLEVLVIGWD